MIANSVITWITSLANSAITNSFHSVATVSFRKAASIALFKV
jgi:hypothetical protein